MEAIDVIEAFGLNFRVGNALKYILRAGKKGDAATDLRKAVWYLNRELCINTEERLRQSAGAANIDPAFRATLDAHLAKVAKTRSPWFDVPPLSMDEVADMEKGIEDEKRREDPDAHARRGRR